MLWLFGIVPPVRNLILGRRLRCFNEALPLVGRESCKWQETGAFFASNFLMPWRANALSRSSDKTLSKWVRIEGERNFIDAIEKGHGVVLLNSHTGASRLVPLVMLQRGYVVNTMEPEPWLKHMGAKGAENIKVIELRAGDNFWLKELFQAKSVLDRNEILHLAVDGLQGRKGIDFKFLGKSRIFFTSFAELAVRTKAAAVPVFSTIDARGRVTVTFAPELDMGEDTQEDIVRVKYIIGQYIKLLEEQWRNGLGNIVAKHIHNYLQLKDIRDIGSVGSVSTATARK
jgi:KDO2-lipid IV(A) lauroyltransferase